MAKNMAKNMAKKIAKKAQKKTSSRSVPAKEAKTALKNKNGMEGQKKSGTKALPSSPKKTDVLNAEGNKSRQGSKTAVSPAALSKKVVEGSRKKTEIVAENRIGASENKSLKVKGSGSSVPQAKKGRSASGKEGTPARQNLPSDFTESGGLSPGSELREPGSSTSSGKRSRRVEGTTDEETRWLELREKHRNTQPQVYKLSGVFVEKTPIEHKIMGWGFVLSVVNDRLEVLFRSGIKHLISNYKPNT